MQPEAPDDLADLIAEDVVDPDTRSSAGVVFALPLASRARATLPRVPLASTPGAGNGSGSDGTSGTVAAGVRVAKKWKTPRVSKN